MLLLYALARPIASSVSQASSTNSTSFDPVTGECIDIHGCRTTTGIIWSCLSVIFICTWVAIHPNIPTVQGWRGKPWHPAALVYQNVELMIVALLAPEFMLLWAMRQREQAKKIRDKFQDKYGWGMSHGFFVIMGGLALYDGSKFCGYIWDRERTGELEDADDRPFDGRAEKYLKDIKTYHSKHQELDNRDENEKALESSALLASHENSSAMKPTETDPLSPSSEPKNILEFLVAKGYITLTEDDIKDNFSHSDVLTKLIAVIQTTWFILQVIARAVDGLAITELEIITVGFAILNFGTYFLWWNKPLRVRHPIRVYWRQREIKIRRRGAAKGGRKGKEEGKLKGRIWRMCSEGAGAVLGYIQSDANPIGLEWIYTLIFLPLSIPFHIFHLASSIAFDNDDSKLAIPISSRLDNDPLHLYIIVYGIAALFGAIHCIPWVFHFPTHTEQILWRISAVAVAVAPVAMGASHGYIKLNFADSAPDWIGIPVSIILLILPVAYAAFRTMLLVIAFTALRDLSPSAYQTVQWTTFWPHIG